MALGSHEAIERKPYETPTIQEGHRVIEGVFPPTLLPVPITSLSPTHLIDGFMPHASSKEQALLMDFAQRDENKLLELIEIAAVDFGRGTPEFFHTVISLALHQSD